MQKGKYIHYNVIGGYLDVLNKPHEIEIENFTFLKMYDSACHNIKCYVTFSKFLPSIAKSLHGFESQSFLSLFFTFKGNKPFYQPQSSK